MPLREDDYERPVVVTLSCNSERIDEREVEFVNIEENFYGEDVLTFKCPRCGEIHKSLRLG